MNTVKPVAPSAFSVAMTSRRRSRWLLTALATPTPPTISAVRPTRVRNWVKRSTLRSSRGEALVRRADFPAGLGQLRAARRRRPPSRRRRLRRCREAAGDSSSAPRCRAAPDRWRAAPPRSRGDAAQSRCRWRACRARRSARREARSVREPIVMRAPGLRSSRASKAGSAAAPNTPSRSASASASGCARIEHDRAVERIGAIDRLHFDQRGAPPSGVRAIARSVAASDIRPRLCMKARSSGLGLALD